MYNKDDIFSIQLRNPENISVHELVLTEELKEQLGFNDNSKTHYDWLAEYLSKKEIDYILELLRKLLIKTISPEQKIKCVHCGGNKLLSPHNTSKLCTIFLLESNLMFNLAAKEFISIIEKNRVLLKTNRIKKLTRIFFTCFTMRFGRSYFNLDKLKSACVKEGLSSIAELLKNSSVFERFKIINDSTHILKEQLIYHNLEYSRGNKYVKTQIDWFEEQHRYYKNDQEIEEKYSRTKPLDEPKNENPYPHIFKDSQAFDFFTRLLEVFEIKTSKFQIADLTDIYILMKRDGYIIESFRPISYINWLNETYDFISITRLLTVSTRKIPSSKTRVYDNSK